MTLEDRIYNYLTNKTKIYENITELRIKLAKDIAKVVEENQQEVASGKVERLNCREYDESGFVIDECGEGEFVIGDKNMSDILGDYEGKDIKIYIKEVR